MAPRGGLTLGTVNDPAGLSRAPKAPAIFDPAVERNVGMPMALRPHGKPDSGLVLLIFPDGRRSRAAGPNDELLIATYVQHGMPRQAAEQVRSHGPSRFLALRFWCDVRDAAEGDKAAKERVDYHRFCWQEMRKMELIADDPMRTIGTFDR